MKNYKNWWYYHKWYVLGGLFLLFLIFRWLSGAFGWFEKTPDLQIAYVGSPLPEDAVRAVTGLFSELARDYNQDGEVVVKLNRYSSDPSNTSSDGMYYQYASEVELIGDITNCDSYFFLMEDPEDLQKRFQILALPDGSEPAETDFSASDKCFSWSCSALLSEPDLGVYMESSLGTTVSGEIQEKLAGLFLGRRFFHDEKKVKYEDECRKLWKKLAEDAGFETSHADPGTTADAETGSASGKPAESAGHPEIISEDPSVEGSDSRSSAVVGPFTAPSDFRDFTLLDNKDILAASGLYYAAWTAGEPVPYTNSDGEDVDLYDAEIYFLVQESEDPATVLEARDSWLSAARDGYRITEEKEQTIDRRSYTILFYDCDPETSPFSRGISAFSASGLYAHCVELTCRANYKEDLEPVLMEFLAALQQEEQTKRKSQDSRSVLAFHIYSPFIGPPQ